MDRRALFFLVAALVCGLLSIPTGADLRWVPETMTIAYIVLAGLSALDYQARRRDPRPPDIERSEIDQPNRPVT